MVQFEEIKLNKDQAQSIELRYQMEDAMVDGVRNGIPAADLKMPNDLPKDFDNKVYRLDDNYLRDRKNGLVIRKTLLRVAAREGGVAPLYLHIISEKYASIIENATSADYLDHDVFPQMYDDFSAAVRYYSTKKYSPLVSDMLIYIDNHFTENINCQTIAEALHFHPTYLSKTFKEELGYGVSYHINNQRIQYAQLLISRGQRDYAKIAFDCGFNSQSYFSKIFKKVTGQRPSDYTLLNT